MLIRQSIVRCAAVCVALAGCKSSEPPPSVEEVVIRDSAGVALIEYAGHGDAAALQVGAEPAVTVDGANTEAPLHQVVGAGRLSDGRIVVMNGDPIQIMVHDRSGQLLRTFSREGHGPGEFRAPVHFRVLQGDTIVAWDAMYGPSYAFDAEGRLIKETHTDLARLHDALGDSTTSEAGMPLPGLGYLASVAPRGSATPGAQPSPTWTRLSGSTRYSVVLPDYELHDAGHYTHLITAIRGARQGRQPAWLAPMYFHLSKAAFSPATHEIFISDGSTYRVDVRDTSGRLLRSIRREAPPLRLSDAEYDRSFASWRRRYPTLQDEDLREALAVLPDMHELPPILDLVVDADGYLWVRERMHEWSVYGPDGKLWRRATLPVFKVYDIGSDYVLGLVRDDDGVESVVEYRLTR